VGLSPSELSACFPTVADLLGMPNITSLTPASTLSSKQDDKESPKAGGDAAGKPAAELKPSDWLPRSLYAGTTEAIDIDSLLGGGDMFNMDWDTVYPADPQVGKKNLKRKGDDVQFDVMMFSGQL
jgi:hypothetical protein